MQISERVRLVGSSVCLCARHGGARSLDSRLDRVWSGFRCGAGHSSMRAQLQEARWLLKSLEIRNETLMKVARSIVERQTASPVIVVAATMSVVPRKFGPPESP